MKRYNIKGHDYDIVSDISGDWIYYEISKKLTDLINKQLDFTFVSEQEPPHQVDLLVKAPNGLIHIANWRPAYNIFTCQDKPESSYDWSWKLI
jgi:hypothetical protein